MDVAPTHAALPVDDEYDRMTLVFRGSMRSKELVSATLRTLWEASL